MKSHVENIDVDTEMASRVIKFIKALENKVNNGDNFEFYPDANFEIEFEEVNTILRMDKGFIYGSEGIEEVKEKFELKEEDEIVFDEGKIWIFFHSEVEEEKQDF